MPPSSSALSPWYAPAKKSPARTPVKKTQVYLDAVAAAKRARVQVGELRKPEYQLMQAFTVIVGIVLGELVDRYAGESYTIAGMEITPSLVVGAVLVALGLSGAIPAKYAGRVALLGLGFCAEDLAALISDIIAEAT